MTDPRLIDYEPLTGISEYYHFDPQTNGFVIETRQDQAVVDSILELNKAVVNDNTGWKGEWHHVAAIPLSVMMQLAQQGIVTTAGEILDLKRYKAFLNDPSNAHFRVKRGRI